MDRSKAGLLWVLAIVSCLLAGCAASGSSGPIRVSDPQTFKDADTRRMLALDAAEEVLLSRGFDPVRVEKEKGYMKYMLQADSSTVQQVNVRLEDDPTGNGSVDMKVDVQVLRTESARKTGLSVGGGMGVGSGGGLFGIGIGTSGPSHNNAKTRREIKEAIASAVEKALADI